MRAPRTFVFYHHEPFGPFNLADLHAGQARYGGSVARLRLLFSLAQRGHDVWIVGNVHSGSHAGVRAQYCTELSAFSPPPNPVTLVFNNPPPESDWASYTAAPWPRAHTAIWAGNHFERRWMDRLEQRKLDRIVCVSRWHREYYRIFRGFPRIEVSYSGVDKDFLLPRDAVEPNTILSLSVPRRSKGVDRLFAAWRIVRRQCPDAKLRISGTASMHDPKARLGASEILDADVEAQFPDLFDAGASGMRQAGIELLGRRSLPEVYAALSRCAFAVVNPGFGTPETFCRAAVEAQAGGVAVVGAASGALNEVVSDGRTGLLVREDRPEALADALTKLLLDPDLADDMGRHGPAWCNWLADYALIAPDWEGIAERAESDQPAPSEPHAIEDRLRELGYGAARNWVRETLSSRARQLLRRSMRG